ncbi:MAG: hypothetical protein IJT73_10580 [Selenomonadaceae bacterium]|nr:hypothetical protein [Selenomonadaceae bacterium]
MIGYLSVKVKQLLKNWQTVTAVYVAQNLSNCRVPKFLSRENFYDWLS